MIAKGPNVMTGGSKMDYKATVANLRTATDSVKEKLPPLLDQLRGVFAKADGAMTNASATTTVRTVAAIVALPSPTRMV